MILLWSCPGNMPKYYPGLRDILPRGGSKGGGAHPARTPPPKIGKNIIFWRKIVIFHTKYPKKFRASLRSVHFFLSAPPPPPNLKSWIRPCYPPLRSGNMSRHITWTRPHYYIISNSYLLRGQIFLFFVFLVLFRNGPVSSSVF